MPINGNLPDKWDKQADVVVIGFGAAGAAAAITAQDAGASVLMLEKAPKGRKVETQEWRTKDISTPIPLIRLPPISTPYVVVLPSPMRSYMLGRRKFQRTMTGSRASAETHKSTIIHP